MWVQCIFPLLGVDDVKISSPDYKVCECNFVGDVLVSIQGNNGRRNQAPVDEAGDYPDVILITEASDYITVSMED